MDVPKFIPLVCLFCGVILEGPEDVEYSSGDLIECTQCGEQNDYDSVLQVAKEKGVQQAKEAIEEQLRREFKDLFRN
jgi:hypothetical protein